MLFSHLPDIRCLPFCFWLISIFSIQATAQEIVRLNKSKISVAELDSKIQLLLAAGKVHGLEIAIFNDKKPVYKRAFGYKRLDTKEPLSPTSNMYGASLSKVVFATLVMKLVEEGVLILDKPLQRYLPKPIYEYTPTKKWHDNYADLKTDTLYDQITARMCLTHTTGFPNWRWFEADKKLRVKRIPGSRYGYSGEGLVYLQVVLEHMLGKSLENLVQEKVFKTAGMMHSSYQWQPAYEADFAFGHQSDGTLYEKDKDNEARSASTLETTLNDYVLFSEAILQNRILKPTTTKAMFTTQIRIHSVQQFGPWANKDSTTNDGIELGYGLGWGLLKTPYGFGAFKEGHGDGFQHYSILFPESGNGIVLMSNSDNAEGIFKELLELAIGDTFTPWYWENYIPFQR